jgi:hypothetical protein
VFTKLAAVILGIGIVGCSLLALRQQRLQAASELARVQVRIRAQDERLWELRTQISRAVNPENIREMALTIGPLRPLVAEGDARRMQRVESASPRVVEHYLPVPLPPGPPRASPPLDSARARDVRPAPAPAPARKSTSGPRYATLERPR